MALEVIRDELSGVFELHIRGLLERAEFVESERIFAEVIRAGGQPLVMVVLDAFEGWEKNDGWNNLDFMFSHGNSIAKIAIVGAGSKEAEVRAFTGAGMRPTPVEFFAAGEEERARLWLTA